MRAMNLFISYTLEILFASFFGSKIPYLISTEMSNCYLYRFWLFHFRPHLHRPDNIFSVHQGILTPTLSFILLHPFSSVHRLAKIAGKYYQQWLNKADQLAGPDGINITLIDFFATTYPTYIRDVVSINYKTWPNDKTST